MKHLEIRVDTGGVHLTGVDGDDRFDLARVPRVTGTTETFAVDDLVDRFHVLNEGVTDPADAPAQPKAQSEPEPEPEPNATKRAIELADENDVDLSAIDGSGPDGRVYVDDVRAAIGGESEPADES